jgi:hypothetical protein
MSYLITQGSTVIQPQVIDGYSSTSQSASKVHTIMGRTAPAITLRPGGLRRGTLRMVFGGTTSGGGYAIIDGILTEIEGFTGASEDLSLAAETAHRDGGVFTLTVTERSTVSMQYIVDGSVTRELDDATRDVWIVSVDFQEVD